jgi:hypothetical protein
MKTCPSRNALFADDNPEVFNSTRTTYVFVARMQPTLRNLTSRDAAPCSQWTGCEHRAMQHVQRRCMCFMCCECVANDIEGPNDAMCLGHSYTEQLTPCASHDFGVGGPSPCLATMHAWKVSAEELCSLCVVTNAAMQSLVFGVASARMADNETSPQADRDVQQVVAT